MTLLVEKCPIRSYATRQALAILWVVLIGFVFSGATAAAGEWDQVLEAAKKEGWLAVAHGGNAGPDVRRLYTEGFMKEFPEIKVNMTVAGGRSIAPRMLMEQRVGKHLWDLYMGGTTTALGFLIPAGLLDDIRPALALPEVMDLKKWFGGQLEFADDAGKYNLVFGGRLVAPFVVNTKLANPAEIRSYWDLLDPKWKGKMVMQDPRSPGNGLAMATHWYFTPALGKKFMSEIFTKQDVKVTRDSRQLLEWVARGDYHIGLAYSSSIYEGLKGQGLPMDVQTADNMKEGSYLTSGVAGVGLVASAPHPNAAKVFINWLLNRKTQTEWSKASGNWSRRLDVPVEHLEAGIVPNPARMDSYQANYLEKWVSKRDEIQKFLRTVIK